MPKMKSVSGAKKRFRRTAKGGFKRFKMGKSHILTSKTRKRKRRLRQGTMVDSASQRAVQAMLPYA